METHILSYVTFLPLVGVVAILLTPQGSTGGRRLIRWWSLLTSLAVFALSLKVYTAFDSGTAGFQLVEKHPWIPSYGISYYLGLDGLSFWLILLTTFLTPLTILSTWKAIDRRVKEFHVAMLVLETAMIGTFVALDLFLFYVFWELMLIPMYLIIGVWGGERRIYAAIKFFLYTAVGSLLMLVCIIGLVYFHHQATGELTFNLLSLYGTELPRLYGILFFAAFALAFAIKVPMFPLHTWLPDAHVEAPTAGSVILAGVLLKMGTYGFLRFAMPLFPEGSAYFAPLIIGLSLAGIIYGALVAMVQPDVKKLVAYSSVSHLGYCMLGLYVLSPQGVEGSILQMVNHGISTGALFLLVGVIYERRHTRLISEYGGIARVMPVYSSIFLIVTLSSIGLPTTNGFVGEFLILLGTFKVYKWAAVIAATGVILGAVYMLWMVQRVFYGPVTNAKNEKLPDLSLRELGYLLPLVALIFWIGLYPNFFLEKMHLSVDRFISQVQVAGPVASAPGARLAAAPSENPPAGGIAE
ncbi:NADH-quinone oxidoreductase subunit M [Dissulfurirhabdus thermomarina]|uniref:NADH-quinone oxidoreductase subunit M n=1 Tax=Dissulfurirhabdus thermomarina TaxID=1765737 RepID=A0A6N9TK62_DISTH|nr:NADH-quinone oxidoreductase subunit M [Dissulfurirhabdus thermomarina]NDY41468.1 NADH-quinone oxidoreductase subunit M [Dissulfurirhabdus thermomarina]NMX24250.1 NADH-quinone oxidoreductase subunit M [Dissulfurirhabdus thermomarina]